MTSRARMILIIVCALSLVAVATSGRAQTAVEQKVNAFVEGLRGRVSEAIFENGRYRHAGIAFDVPAGWNYGGTIPGENPADDTVHWTDPGTGVAIYAWLSKRQAAPEDVSGLLASVVSDKTRQRQRQGFRRWVVRPESVHQILVGGHQGLNAIADFESRAGGMRVEYLTWVYTPESRVLFFATMSADQLATFRPEFDRMVQSASLP
jgi:hypothetical protein